MLYRTVVEETYFADELEILKKEYPNIYDIKDAASWELGRRPYAYPLLPNENAVRIFNTFKIGYTPTFRVLYKYEEDADPRVFLLSISPIKEDEE